MTSFENPKRPLPPLATATNYEATDFERFEYLSALLTGSKANLLRLHLKNGTTLDLPASDEALKYLLVMLCEAFPLAATAHVKSRGWI